MTDLAELLTTPDADTALLGAARRDAVALVPR